MASPKSKRDREQKRRKKSAGAPARESLQSLVEEVDVLPEVAPISWSDVGQDLRQRWRRLNRTWDWSDPKRSPLMWALPPSLAATLRPWCKGLSECWAKRLPAEKTAKKWSRWVTQWCVQTTESLEAGLQAGCSLLESESAWRLGLEANAAAWLLPCLADAIHSRDVERLLAVLLELSDAEPIPGDCPVAAWLWQVELPLTLSALMPGDVFPPSLKHQALDRLRIHVEGLTDGNGMIAQAEWTHFTPLLAGWIRVWGLEPHVPELAKERETRDRCRLAGQQYLRHLRTDGSLILSQGYESPLVAGLVRRWLQMGNDPEERTLVEMAIGDTGILAGMPTTRLKEAKVSDASDYSEWGKIAVLRSRWKRKSDKLAVGFDHPRLSIELQNRDRWLLGEMGTEIRWGKQTIELSDVWSEICWQSDEDTVYLELQNDFVGGGGHVQRQFLLAKKERFCLLAEAVQLEPDELPAKDDESSGVSDEPMTSGLSVDSQGDVGLLQHRWTLPLADGVKFEAAKETREGVLMAGKARASVVPLTLPEWRVESPRGELKARGNNLLLTSEMPSTQLYQAVLIDLDRRRSQKALSWQRLTVGENLEKVTPDRALAVRVQLHRQQFLVYRSLTPPSSRSFMGQNVYCDFYLGRFLPDGMAETMLMIEGA